MPKKTATCRILNTSQQTISLQVKRPGGDFYVHEQQVRLNPGQHVLLPKNHLNENQIRNLRSKRIIRLTFDSDATVPVANRG